MPSTWISLTSLLLVTFVFLSLTTGKVEGKQGEVEKMGKGQSLGEHAGKEGHGKAKLKLKKRKLKRRKKKSKQAKVEKSESDEIKREKGKRRKETRKDNESKRNKEHSKNKNKDELNNKETYDKRKLRTGKEKEEPTIENQKSTEIGAVRQIANESDADPDRYNHCDYLDLVEVGYREDSICKPGDKVVFKGGKGIRRQFLMTPQTNIVVFLEQGKKVTSCNNTFNDVTSKVRCKPVNGVNQISSIVKKNAPVSSCSRCPGSRQEACPATTQAPTTGSDTEITCRCPPQRFFSCIYKVESNANSHTVTCNEGERSVTKITCGSELVAKTTGSLQLERYTHPLCTTKEYTSILLDLTWSCKDKSVPVAACENCDGSPCDGNGNGDGATTASVTDNSGSMSTRRPPRRFQILK